MQDNTHETFISVKQLSARYNVSVASVWRWIQKSDFPSPVKLSPGCTRWRSSDLKKWEDAHEAEV